MYKLENKNGLVIKNIEGSIVEVLPSGQYRVDTDELSKLIYFRDGNKLVFTISLSQVYNLDGSNTTQTDWEGLKTFIVTSLFINSTVEGETITGTEDVTLPEAEDDFLNS